MKETKPFAGFIVDKETRHLYDISKEDDVDVSPNKPDDLEDFEKDVSNAMDRLSKDGGEFYEETKMKFYELRRKAPEPEQKVFYED